MKKITVAIMIGSGSSCWMLAMRQNPEVTPDPVENSLFKEYLSCQEGYQEKGSGRIYFHYYPPEDIKDIPKKTSIARFMGYFRSFIE